MIRFFGRLIGAVLTVCIIAVSALLALNNPDAVAVSLWPLDISLSMPLWLVIALAFGAGLLIGAAVMIPSYLKTRLALRQKGKSLDKITKESADKKSSATTALPSQ